MDSFCAEAQNISFHTSLCWWLLVPLRVLYTSPRASGYNIWIKNPPHLSGKIVALSQFYTITHFTEIMAAFRFWWLYLKMKVQEIVRKCITMQAFFWKGLDPLVNSKRDREYLGSDETPHGLTQCKKKICCFVCFIWK